MFFGSHPNNIRSWYEEGPKNIRRSLKETLSKKERLSCQGALYNSTYIFFTTIFIIAYAFTPGSNGKNDIFYAKGSGVNVIRHFRIYNCWGQLVFEKNNIGIDDRSAGWDGKFKGQYVEAGTYVYMAGMECIAGEIFTFKGTVTVVK